MLVVDDDVDDDLQRFYRIYCGILMTTNIEPTKYDKCVRRSNY